MGLRQSRSHAAITQSLVTEGAVVDGRVHHSVLFYDITIRTGTKIYNSVIFPDTVIDPGAKVYQAIVGENAHIGEGAVIGGALRDGERVDNALTGSITLVGNDICIRSGAYLPRGTVANEDERGGDAQ